MEIEQIKAFAGKVYGMSDEEVTSTFMDGEKLKPDYLDVLMAKDAERIKKLKDDHTKELTTQHDNGHKKGLAEALDTWEKKIKETYKYEGQEKGDELVKAIIKANQKTPVEKDIKLSPEYLDLEKRLTESDTLWQKKLTEEVEKVKADYQKKDILTAIHDKAWTMVTEMKPILPENQAIRDTWKKSFLNEFSNFDYQLSENEVVISEAGKRKDDPHGQPYKFKSLVEDIAKKYFEFPKQDPKGSGGADGTGTKTIGTVPDKWDDFQKYLLTLTTEEERSKAWVAWETMKKAQ